MIVTQEPIKDYSLDTLVKLKSSLKPATMNFKSTSDDWLAIPA